MKDMNKRGRRNTVSMTPLVHPKNKFRISDVIKIVNMYLAGSPCGEIAPMFGVCEATVRRLINKIKAEDAKLLVRDKRMDNRGEDHPLAKLSADKVREARRLRDRGWGFKKLSDRYGVAPAVVRAAVSGKTWGHVV